METNLRKEIHGLNIQKRGALWPEEKTGKIGDALLKVALGYRLQEITEEYAEVDGKFKLTRRKETKKDIPPDLKAVQLLLGFGHRGLVLDVRGTAGKRTTTLTGRAEKLRGQKAGGNKKQNAF